jgi:hypothetical protein
LYFNPIVELLAELEGGVCVYNAHQNTVKVVRSMLTFITSDIRGNKMLNNAQAPARNGACDKCDIQGFQTSSKGATIYACHCRYFLFL